MTLLSVLRPTTNQVGTNLVSDTFDADTIGGVPANWTAESGTSWTVQTAPAGLSGRSLQGVNDASFDNYLRRQFTRQTGGEVRIKWRVKTGSSTAARAGVMTVYDTTGGVVVQLGPLIGQWNYGNGSGLSGNVGSWAANTVYVVELTIDMDQHLFKFAVNDFAYDNAGAWFPITTGTTGIDRVKFSVFSSTIATFYIDDFQVGTLVPTSSPPTTTGTLSTSGTFDGVTLGPDRFGRIVLGYANSDPLISRIKLERSANNSTWVDISAVAKVTATAAGRWTVIDPRPQYGSQSTTYGGNIFYRVSGANSGGSTPTSASGSMTSDVDKTAFETNRFPVLAALFTGGTAIPSSNVGEAYPGYPLAFACYAYKKTGTQSYLDLASAQFTYIQGLTQSNGVIMFPDWPDAFYRDFHFRTVLYVAACSRLLRRAGATTLADSMVSQCDSWVSAWFNNLNGGVITTSRAIQGFDANNESTANNQTAWQASHAYVLGDIVAPTSRNGRTYRVTTAGTTAATQPTWPTTAGGTVTNGSVTFTETTVTATVGYGSFGPTTPYPPNAGSDAMDLNQVMETAAALVLLLTDTNSALASAGALRTAALQHVTDLTTSVTPFATSTGAIPIGEAYPAVNGPEGYDTVYATYTMFSMAVVLNYLASQANQWMDEMLDKGIAWVNSSYGTEPSIGGVHYSGATAIYAEEITAREYPAATRSITASPPVHKLRYTAALNLPATDEWAEDYDANGFPLAMRSQMQPRTFQYDVFLELLNAAAQNFSATLTAVSPQAAAKVVRVNATRTAAGSEAAQVVRQTQARRTGASVNATAVTRSTAATRTGVSPNAAQVIKRPAHTVTATSTQVASLTTARVTLRTFTATSSQATTLAKAVSVARTATSANTGSITRAVSVTRSAASIQAATLATVKAKLLTLTASSTQTASVTKQARAVRAATSVQQATVASRTTRTLSAASANAGQVVKRPAHTLTATSTQAASVSALKLRTATLTAISTQAASIARQARVVRGGASVNAGQRLIVLPPRTLTATSTNVAQATVVYVPHINIAGILEGGDSVTLTEGSSSAVLIEG